MGNLLFSGPIEAPIKSKIYQHNYTLYKTHFYHIWNEMPLSTQYLLPNVPFSSNPTPSDAQFEGLDK